MYIFVDPKINVINFFISENRHTCIKTETYEGIKPKNSFLHSLVFLCSSKIPNNKKNTMVNICVDHVVGVVF